MSDDAEREPDLDETLVLGLEYAISKVGMERYLAVPLVVLDEHCFPDPWEPNLVGVRAALRRLMRHVGLPDVPVVVEDARADALVDGLVQEPVLFDGIEDGAAHFIVQSVGRPEVLVTWLVMEVVRAWAEYQGITREDALAYRAPAEDVPERERGMMLAAPEATMIGVALGLGPLLAIGTIQTHKQEQLRGGYAVGEWAMLQVGGLVPMALARFLALHGLSRGAVPEELERTRESLSDDLRLDFDAARSEWADATHSLRTQLGLPLDPPVARQPVDASPLPVLDEAALVRGEQAFAERIRFFNRGREIYAVIERRTGMGAALGMLLGVPVVALAVAVGSTVGGAMALYPGCMVLGGLVGRSRTYLRCADQECRGMIGAAETTCPFCGGTIKGQLRSANQRLDDPDE